MPNIPQPDIDNLDSGSYHQTKIRYYKVRSATLTAYPTIADRIKELEAAQASPKNSHMNCVTSDRNNKPRHTFSPS